jgi:hypothetical protein
MRSRKDEPGRGASRRKRSLALLSRVTPSTASVTNEG